MTGSAIDRPSIAQLFVLRLDGLFAHRLVGAVLFMAFLVLWATLAKAAVTRSWQEQSRMATVQTLVEQGTFIIDHTLFNNTGDKIFVNGHFYSDKTPLLSVAAAGLYSVLYNVFHLTLDPIDCIPDDDPAACRAFGPGGPRFTAFYWLNLAFMSLPSALLVVLFWKALIDQQVGGLTAVGLAVLLGIASPIAPYSIVFVGHVPAALFLFAGFMLLARPTASGRAFFWAGLFVSLAANIDLLLALFVVAFGAWISLTRRSHVLPFAVGALIPFAMTAAINYWAAGTIVPLYLDPKAYDFPGTVLNKTVGGTDGFYSLEFGLNYAYEMLVGRRGVFAFTPLLVCAVAGLWLAARDRSHRLRSPAIAVIAASLAFTAYLILRTDNFGGVAWGTRWFVPLIPVLWTFIPLVFTRSHSRAWKAVLLVTAIVSLLTALPGLHDPWGEYQPIFRL
ncbi:MAG TPA: hypothetical protein VFL17_05905 [Anaerolineae bacterium]|nr:hypothetical protein [Anaerolineae bacterium]